MTLVPVVLAQEVPSRACPRKNDVVPRDRKKQEPFHWIENLNQPVVPHSSISGYTSMVSPTKKTQSNISNLGKQKAVLQQYLLGRKVAQIKLSNLEKIDPNKVPWSLVGGWVCVWVGD